MRKFRGRLTYSNVVATLALFLALTGGAAWALKKNSVKSKQIKDGQVASVDVKDNDLTGTDINETSLSGLTAAPSGPAAGALTGSYPAPTIANGAVGSAEIGDGQIGTADQARVPAARVGRSSDLPITDATPTTPGFNSEGAPDEFDTADLHSPTSSRLTAPVPGIYYVRAEVTWASDSDNDEIDQRLAITHSADGVIAVDAIDGFDTTNTADHEVSTLASMSAGEYVNLSVYQDNTDNDSLNLTNSANLSPRLEMAWLGPAP